MRKANREVKDIEKIVEVMKKCEVCRIALNDEEYPYILPLVNICLYAQKVVSFFEGNKADWVIFIKL